MVNTDYVISTGVWDVTNSVNAVGVKGTVNTGRAFYAGNSSSDTLSTLDPGSKIGQHHGTRVRIPANVLSVGGPTGIYASATNYPTDNFGTMTAGSYVMKMVTTTLASVSNTFLRSGASYMSGRRSINKLETVRTWQVATAIRAGNWNIFTGTFSASLNETEDATTPSTNNQFNAFDQQAGRGATSGTLDSAANPSQLVPGELIIHHGSGLPLNADYSPRTTW